MSRRRSRTRPTGPIDPVPAEQVDELEEAAKVVAAADEIQRGTIPDEEIDAEDADTQARVAEEDAALADYDATHTDPDYRTSIERAIDENLADTSSMTREEFIEKVSMPVEDREEFDRQLDETVFDDEESEPDFDPEIFERGPLAAGIRMLEALLTEARAGYITAQIGELERVLDEQIGEGERVFLGQAAAQERTASGLPDVAGAYRALVRARVRAGA